MVIGLMGGIGSGKSTVLNYLEHNYRAYIIQSDYVAKELMTPGYKVFDQICDMFSNAVTDGVIDNHKLAQIVFNDEKKLQQLNAITHPGTIKEIIKRIKESKSEIIVVESALLLGTGIEEYCDKIWYVFCEKEKRIERLINDRGYSREKAEGIIANQPTDEEYRKMADEIIDNTYSVNDTKEKIDILLSMMECSY